MRKYLYTPERQSRVVFFPGRKYPSRARIIAEKIDADFIELKEREAGGTIAGTMALTGAPPGKTAKEDALRVSLSGWDLLK